ncbi:SIN-like family protein [Tasmannia lanceolata]|uniref:SIN-like family protein n=1 Tax=Tasmannia lanceolata TaxID=3420 RepID=UPI00406460C0
MEKGEEPFNPFNVFERGGGSSMELDLDLDVPNQAPSSSKLTRFQPKSKFKPRPKLEPKSENPSNSLPPTKKEEEPIKPFEPSFSPSISINKSEEEEQQLKEVEESMDVDRGQEEEDSVVREIDIFFNPSPFDTNAQLYVMQYPRRPCWRPYELNERCQEVRVKPKQSKLEVDLDMNFPKENYDEEVAEPLRLQKQTLSSSKAPSVTGYAVGILVGNKLHLNPVHAAVQLRPSLAYLDTGGIQKKNKAAGNTEITANSVEGKSVSKSSNENDRDDAEAWVSLEYHGMNSSSSSRYRQKMVARDSCHVQFSMSSDDYVNSLCPGRPNDNNKAKGPSRSFLLSLPFEERFKKLFSEGSDMHRFDALMHLAPADSKEDVLKVLQQHAVLIQGLWVAKSSLRCSGVTGNTALARDYILLLFSKSRFIHQNQIKFSKFRHEILEPVLSPLAVERPDCRDWKFRDTDDSFIKGHPDIVKEQEQAWSRREKLITDALHGSGKSASTMKKNSLKPNVAPTSGNADQSTKGGINGTQGSGTKFMSAETLEVLPKALLELFRIHKVCSLQLICQGLRDMAVSKTYQPKVDSRVALAALQSASAPLPELQSVISQIAMHIHGVYVLKSLGIPAVDPLRNVVINLFLAKEANAKLKKADIVEAARIALKREISNSEYTQVLNELCVSKKGGAWLLKSGDGKPK